MKSVISDNKIIPFLPCYKRTSQLHETKVSDLKTYRKSEIRLYMQCKSVSFED